MIFGTADAVTGDQPRWTSGDASIIIDKNDVVSISLATEDVDDHLMEQPIYGIVDCMTNENGNELIDTGASPAGNVAAGAKEENMTTGRNQTNGEGLCNLSSGVQDLERHRAVTIKK